MNRTRSMYLGEAQRVIGVDVPVPGTRKPRPWWRRVVAKVRRVWVRRKLLGVEFMASLAVAAVMLFGALLVWAPWLARVLR